MRLALVAAIVAFLVLLRPIATWISMRRLARGRAPDRVRLVSASPKWRNPQRAADLQTELAALGFAWVGDYVIPELPSLAVRLLVRVDEGVYAAIWESKELGAWLELVSRYDDGRRATLSTRVASGEREPPWHVVALHLPGINPRDAFARILSERPRDPVAKLAPETLPALCEEEYARTASWRRSARP